MSLEMHPCPHCPAQFDALKSLEHHLKVYHDESLPSEKYRCTTCDAEFMARTEWMDTPDDGEQGEAAAGEAA